SARAVSIGKNFVVVRDLRGFAEHDRSRAVFAVRELDRAFDCRGFQIFASYDEVHVDLGEHLGIGFRALGAEQDLARGNALAALPEDQHHVVGGAAAGPGEHRFHRTRPQVTPPALARTVHDESMAAFSFGDEAHAVGADPFDFALHWTKRSL